MANFITVYTGGREMLVNLDWVMSVEKNHKGDAVICCQQFSMTADDYGAVKRAIRGDNAWVEA